MKKITFNGKSNLRDMTINKEYVVINEEFNGYIILDDSNHNRFIHKDYCK